MLWEALMDLSPGSPVVDEADVIPLPVPASPDDRTAQVAHDVRNLLACVLAASGLIERNVDMARRADGEETARSLEEIRELSLLVQQSSRRAGQLLDDMVQRPREIQRHADLGEVLEFACRAAAFRLSGRARLVCRLDGAPVVRGQPEVLEQVFLNLLLNAAAAIDGDDADREEVEVRWEERGRLAVVTVRDTGCGMTPAALRKVFRPRFTTRPGGTGLGLPSCREAVEALGGGIAIESRPGEGTVVEVILPLATEPV